MFLFLFFLFPQNWRLVNYNTNVTSWWGIAITLYKGKNNKYVSMKTLLLLF